MNHHCVPILNYPHHKDIKTVTEISWKPLPSKTSLNIFVLVLLNKLNGAIMMSLYGRNLQNNIIFQIKINSKTFLTRKYHSLNIRSIFRIISLYDNEVKYQDIKTVRHFCAVEDIKERVRRQSGLFAQYGHYGHSRQTGINSEPQRLRQTDITT